MRREREREREVEGEREREGEEKGWTVRGIAGRERDLFCLEPYYPEVNFLRKLLGDKI